MRLERFKSLKWNMIYHLLRCAWLVYSGRMVPKLIRFEVDSIYIELWAYKHFEDMFKVKGGVR